MRQKDEYEEISPICLAKLVFDDIFINYRNRLHSQPMNFTDVKLLQNFIHEVNPPQLENEEKSLDDIFYEYLCSIKPQTNKNYLTLSLKFIILFKECLYIAKEKIKKESEPFITDYELMSRAPEYCNEFVTEFMESNDYFGIQLEV